MKEWVKKNFPTVVEWRNTIYNYLAHYRFRDQPIEKLFNIIYQENHWRDSESASGTGSNLKNTQEVIRVVNSTIHSLKIKSMLDIPCGDFNWMRNVDLQQVKYLGGDIVKALIDDNIGKYETKDVSFLHMDMLTADLPAVDLIFMRDCLIHLSYKDIKKALASVKKSQSLYWMTTTFVNHRNRNIITGDFRPVNLQAEPFNFPAPLSIASEQFSEDERFADKSLAVWRIADIPVL
jgi:hypothetical protein